MESNSGGCLVSKDVTIEILSRLRVKSLMRFSCVCKYWYTLIKSSTFINKHLHHPNNNARLLFQHHNFITEKCVFALFHDETLSSVPYRYHDINDFHMPQTPDVVIGPFDGIIGLFYSWGREPYNIGLWNPATKQFRSLLIPRLNYPPHFYSYFHVFGCGLDPITNDYKVICMWKYWDERKDTSYNPIVVSVCSLRNDSWRHFEFESTQEGTIQVSWCSTYIHGFYYWVYDSWFGNPTLISFDMSTETFKDGIPGPPNLSKYLMGGIVMYNGSISMMIYDPNYKVVENYIYTWVMEEEGYWTKHLAIGPLLEIHRPLSICKNGDLLIESVSSHLLLYDHNTEEIKNLGPCGKDGCLDVYHYKESLVSVKGGNECKERDNSSYLDQVQDFFKLRMNEEDQTTEES